ncbi:MULTISPECIES: hypothetical protein [Bacillaceae]|uniref:Uncharacterized protein n=1 Tax=Gottfriedia luciferensis TaxID=178774 RepID=A0ABX2ZU92_9BACI|nr:MULTISPECIES: hypothetical protein [Bacillaceae]ODG93380.1 hypothetical protein BED47_03565 [Gottfriedia luciferensis]PGZ88761.1 hypothetical protein COE53_19395 [Bacillus sp. AFS029533]SFC48710.1 hypothetical protein SAMN02799633_00967 [Bacillus sp. UNCCL81]
MNILYDETYTSNDGKRTSRNIWYGDADLTVEGEFGKVINLNEDFMDNLCEIIKNDLSNAANKATETNWYFYGSGVTLDTIGDNIRPTIMVRERSDEYITNFNMSDHDFAVNIDAILLFKADFEKRLVSQ